MKMEKKVDKLSVKIFETRDEMGKNAAQDIRECINRLLKEKDEINMIFAAAPSQNDMLWHLCKFEDIEWERINAFHMDEYVGLEPSAPQAFSNFLKKYIFDLKPFKTVNLIDVSAKDPQKECDRYSELLEKNPVDIVCMGIGENGHIAFNDPHVADFNDPCVVKAVSLDDVCRQQQVNDGCFSKIEEVPQYALTLTVPTLMSAKYNFCIVPAKTKAVAVRNTVLDEINEKCPATILRRKENAVMYLDNDSSSLLEKEIL